MKIRTSGAQLFHADKHGEANSRFLLLCEKGLKIVYKNLFLINYFFYLHVSTLKGDHQGYRTGKNTYKAVELRFMKRDPSVGCYVLLRVLLHVASVVN